MEDIERPRLERDTLAREPEIIEGGVMLKSVETVGSSNHL
jgi:hypothetical protein